MELTLESLLDMIQPYDEDRDLSPRTPKRKHLLRLLDQRVIKLVSVQAGLSQEQRLEYAHHLLDPLAKLVKFMNEQPEVTKHISRHCNIAEALDRKALELSDLSWQADRQLRLAYAKKLIYIFMLGIRKRTLARREA
ncbi:hypothetical protein DM02DRAFT_635678 [Periconia macrospinosa]|uniref:Uncharacterized protein n=1 Tax=Periconia macrospinosa TaxID=97972 RepID=A0A2V1D1Y4_9PLEO|nr:hypothetical protein DM02DRAFT_635678 [Periconia macrospinosa]